MRILSTLFFLLSLFFFVACGGDNASTDADGDMTDATDMEMSSSYAVVDFEQTVDFPDATLTSMDYSNGTFNYELASTDGYQLKQQTPDAGQLMCANSKDGQHIHLIVDNEPYDALYEPTFAKEVSNGEHYILSFLSRSYHQSIKNGRAYQAKKVTVTDGKFTASSDITTPMLFYSRPKGTYVGKDTANLLLDFYPINADLGENYKVKVTVNGEDTALLDEWKSYRLIGLKMGENRVKLTLVDGEGKTVDAPFNPVERVITFQEDPAPAQ